MLTCYDFTTARLMQQAGVPALLVGDSAANVILGYPNTPYQSALDFMIQITAAVRARCPQLPCCSGYAFRLLPGLHSLGRQECRPHGATFRLRLRETRGRARVKIGSSPGSLTQGWR